MLLANAGSILLFVPEETLRIRIYNYKIKRTLARAKRKRAQPLGEEAIFGS